MFRPGRLLALLVLAATLPAVPSHAAAQCRGAAAAARAGRWFVATPPLPDHSQTNDDVAGGVRRIRAVGVDPADPRVLFVTDGEHLHRSDDGGCRWTLVYRLPERAAADAPDRDLSEITSIDVARTGRQTRVLLAVVGTGWSMLTTTRTYLVRSDDGRTGWTYVGDPTTLTGTFDPGHGRWTPVVRSSGDMAYAAVPSHQGTVAFLHSADGGRTWVLKTGLASTEAPVAIHGLAVNPADPLEVWEWGGTTNHGLTDMTGLRYTLDAGKTWTSVDPWPAVKGEKPTWYSADITWPRPGQPARILVLGGVNDPRFPSELPPLLAWSGDGGKKFATVTPPAGTPSVLQGTVTHTSDGDAIVVTSSGATLRIACRAKAPTKPSDWRALARTPVQPSGEWAELGRDAARASATSPALVAVPMRMNVQLLVVGR